MKRQAISLLLTVYFASICNGQTSNTSIPCIGQTFNFTMDSVDNYHKKSISNTDFGNKWIILDFWGENCSGCIASFPKVKEWQREFHKDIQFVFVTQTYRDPQTAIKLFKKLNEKLDLSSIPVSYDQTFISGIGIDGLPTIIIISPKGIVTAITNYITKENIEFLLEGRQVIFNRIYLINESKPSYSYNSKIPFLIRNNGGEENNYLVRSILTEWDSSMPRFNIFIMPNRLEIFKASLESLFRIAYFGKDFWGSSDSSYYGNYYYKPILAIDDSTLFQNDITNYKNLFCYSLSFANDIIEDETFNSLTIQDKPRFKKTMQGDIESYFDLKGTIEMRKMPFYRLVANKEAKEKLKTKGGLTSYQKSWEQKGIEATNVPIKFLIGKINTSVGYPFETMPLLDDTGINDNIDIQIDAVFFEDWLNKLPKHGLDLVPDEKLMKVLVIRTVRPD